MTVSTQLVAPQVRFFSGRSSSYVQMGADWRRLTAEDEARLATGLNQGTGTPSIGISITRRQNGLARIEFDLCRIDVNLRDEARERLQRRWRSEADSLPEPLLRRLLRRTHAFSKSFARFEVPTEHVEDWKCELSAVLENPESFEQLPSRYKPI